MADMTTSNALGAITLGAQVHRPLSSAQRARRQARANVAAYFHIDPNVNTWTNEQIAYAHGHGLLPTERASEAVQHAPSPGNVAAAHTAGQAMSSMILAQRATPPVKAHGSGHTVRQRSEHATMQALRALGL